ncbi:MAG: RNA pseudouridine synthase [Bacteroidales bacterium]|nr:RNA pseudouridine synthase [Bacteroidales bacterium]
MPNTSCFTPFSESIDGYTLPERFTYPFYYQPHPLCILAAKELQNHLQTQTDWHHDFGIDSFVEGTNIGKMFGVMVVKNSDGEIGYLSAFSGKLAGENNWPKFVPPIFDMLKVDGFYRLEEANISSINNQIKTIEQDEQWLIFKANYNNLKQQAQTELQQQKEFVKSSKKDREIRRSKARQELSDELFTELCEQLKQESLKTQYDYKHLSKQWQEKLNEAEIEYNNHKNRIDQLKQERKKRSAELQQQIFNQYQFLNIRGEQTNVGDIFAKTPQMVPPSGAGECAAPKLLQYAFLNNMQPIAIAEFWWGQSPKSEIRKHGNFYPACRGKCKPILGFMLKGMDVDPNPIVKSASLDKEIEIIYEDSEIAIINKPAEFLAVPGKVTDNSVELLMQKKYPDCTGPFIVHRIDMSTSGIMIITKTKEANKNIQAQFIDRSIKKRYVAVLDGVLPSDKGTIDLPLRADIDDRPRQLVCFDHGKPAKTIYKVISRTETQTKVYFYPVTGRTHQLRVHSAHPMGLNTPIIGDDIYGTKTNRLHLHAQQIEFTHPTTGKKMIFKVDEEF